MNELLDEEMDRLLEMDREILTLVSRRLEQAASIARIRGTSGDSGRDFSREKQVVDHGVRVASDLDVSPSLTRTLMETLVMYSAREVEKQELARHASGTGKRALVIGGNGKIGAWFVSFLASQSFCVHVADPGVEVASSRCKKSWQEFDGDYDVIVVAAPLGKSNHVLKALARRRVSGLVFDVASLKSPVREGLMALRDAGCLVTSLHPMFGPSTRMLSGRHVVFIDVGNAAAVKRARGLFDSTMARCVEMNLEEHDQLIAYVLGLSHFLNIAFFTTLKNSGEQARRLKNISSTSFDAQLALAHSIANESPALYYEIQRLNDYRHLPRQQLMDSMAHLSDIIEKGDGDAFEKIMLDGREYLKTLQVENGEVGDS